MMKLVELHVHTEDSQYDSVVKMEDLAKRLKELNCTKVSITEHGTLTSVDAAKQIFDNYQIEYVPGVEAYVRLFPTAPEGRCHLCLYAKDDIGYHAISKAVTKSFELMERKIPVMDEKILKTYFCVGAGHDHVIASSACISGVLANVLQINEHAEVKIKKIKNNLQKKYGKIELSTPSNETVKLLDEQIQLLEAEITQLEPIAEKKYGNKLRGIKKMEKDPDFQSLWDALQKEMQETEKAAARLKEVKAEKKTKKLQRTKANNEYKDQMKKFDKISDSIAKIKELENMKQNSDDLYELAKERALFYQKVFGAGNFYIELQNHHMEEEKRVFPILLKLAKELDIPVVATNDAHMVNGSEESRRARQLIRSMRYIESKKSGQMWQEEGVADKELYVKSEEELKEALLEIMSESDADIAIANRSRLLDNCHVELKFEEHYPKYPSEYSEESSEECLIRKANEGIAKYFPNGFDEEHQKRMETELSTMCSMGFADYHLIVQDYLNYARLLGKFDFRQLPDGFFEHIYDIPWLQKKSKGLLGIGVGPGRGSAVGSLVCYLLGITSVDPLKYGLLFERFLNPERISMPDIDVDFAIHLKPYVYNYVAHKYGADHVCHIMTKNTMQIKKSIDNCSKLLGDRLYGKTTYFDAPAKRLKAMIYDDKFPKESEVKQAFPNDKNILRIYQDAKLVVGTFVSYGMHAGGVVISDTKAVKEHVPLMLDPSGEWKTQCDMIQVEEKHGLLKMDFLGLRNLNIISNTLWMILETKGKKIDINTIPFEREVFESIYGEGNTNGVFQVESPGMKDMLRKAKPTCIEDIIILISMYRPGPMDYLPELLKVMSGMKRPEYLIPELKPILGNTYGAIVYQEQVMQIFQQLAGYSLGGADLVRRAMSKKKMDKLQKEEPAFLYGDESRGIIGCEKNGIPVEKAKILFDQMLEFAKYAFNKSHATAYAIVSYQTAWLKYHYPEEFLCVSMGYVDKKEARKSFLTDCQSLNIEVCLPNINSSKAEFSIKDGKILFGLSYVANVGTKASKIVEERKNNGKYTSFENFVSRTCISGNVLCNLIMTGAFDSFGVSRKILKEKAQTCDFIEAVKKIKDKKKILASEDLTERRRKNAENAIQSAICLLKIPKSFEQDDLLNNLIAEKEYLGIMLSGHPMDDYGTPNELCVTSLANVIPTNDAAIAGVITDLRILEGRKMAFFTLDSKEGTLPVCVFKRVFQSCRDLLVENQPVRITGKITTKEDNFNGENKLILEMITEKMKPLERKKRDIIVYGEPGKEHEIFNKLQKYLKNTGGSPLIYFNPTKGFIKTGMFVQNSILESDLNVEQR